MKVIIAGGRDFNDEYFMFTTLHDLWNNHIEIKDVEIVSGGAYGADFLAEKYAKENGYKLKVIKANWNEFGKSAGPIRNSQMADYADALIAFWDGKSKGTKNMIETAKKKGLKVKIFYY